jgi:hypothetical protein
LKRDDAYEPMALAFAQNGIDRKILSFAFLTGAVGVATAAKNRFINALAQCDRFLLRCEITWNCIIHPQKLG